MDRTTFDSITRSISTSLTRRATLSGLVAAAAAVAGAALLPATESEARRKGKKKKKQNGKLQPGTRCQSSSQCTSGYICAVPVNGSNSDRYCSGGQGATCGAPNGDGDDTSPFCAVGFTCTASGGGYTCQVTPEKM